MSLSCAPFQTAYNPNLRYANGQEVPFRPYEYSKRNLYNYNGQGYYYGNYYGGSNEYYTGNYYIGNYKPTYYYGYTNNYDYYYPEDIKSYEGRIRDGIDFGFFFSVSIRMRCSLITISDAAEPQMPSNMILSQLHPPPILTTHFPEDSTC
jgi:hypothetical protein